MTPNIDKGQAIFGAVLPAPNPTGELHMGHFLNLSVQDALCRWQQGKGCAIFWAGALDHGGSSTEYVAIKDDERLRSGRAKDDAIRERAANWVRMITPVIRQQIDDMNLIIDNKVMRSMGDPQRLAEFRLAIRELGRKGVLYQADRVVPWCPVRKTFVDSQDIERVRGLASYHNLIYRSDYGDELDVSITYPITMLNDVALIVSSAVFEGLVGKPCEVVTPLGKRVPLVVDDDWLLRTGRGKLAAQVTPGHCAHSFRWAIEHGHRIFRAFDECGRVTEAPYEGFERKEAELEMIEVARSAGAYRGLVESIQWRERYRLSGADVEQLLTRQCFLDVANSSAQSLADLDSDRVKVEPTVYRTALVQYLTQLAEPAGILPGLHGSLTDICVSQQTVWGTPFDTDAEEIEFQGPKHIQPSLEHPTSYVATMRLSCALWAFSAQRVFGADLKTLQTLGENSVCVTGMDLTTFWIAPILLLAPSLGFKPFHMVYIHPLICDTKGQKMSKSLGNTQTPAALIETYGVDAVRLALFMSIDNERHRVVLNTALMKSVSDLLRDLVDRIEAAPWHSLNQTASFERRQTNLDTAINERLELLDLPGAAELAFAKIMACTAPHPVNNIEELRLSLLALMPFIPVTASQLLEFLRTQS